MKKKQMEVLKILKEKECTFREVEETLGLRQPEVSGLVKDIDSFGILKRRSLIKGKGRPVVLLSLKKDELEKYITREKRKLHSRYITSLQELEGLP